MLRNPLRKLPVVGFWRKCGVSGGNVILKRHINGERDALSAHPAGRAAGQRSSERLVRVLGIGERTEIVERLVLRPGVRVRDIEEPRMVDEVCSADRTRAPHHPSRA